MRVRPSRPDLIVRDPISRQPVPAEGREVPETSYWLRRLSDGDLERVEEKPAPAGAEASGEPAKSVGARGRRRASKSPAERATESGA